jgi:hypothetical protein
MEAAKMMEPETTMRMVEAVVQDISAKEVRERRRVANPRVAFAEATSAQVGCKRFLVSN